MIKVTNLPFKNRRAFRVFFFINMVRLLRTFLLYFLCICIKCGGVNSEDYYYNQQTDNYYYNYPTVPTISEHPGGTIIDNIYTFTKSRSPYIVRDDIIIERNAEVVIEPGVEIQFEPQIGITVRGILTILVRIYCKINKKYKSPSD